MRPFEQRVSEELSWLKVEEPMISTDAEDKTKTPTTCPFCRSDNVGTTSKSADESAYWRCRKCGEIWSPSRLKRVKIF
jgi:transposase-like protein